MRVEYGLELEDVDVPRFSVEAVEGIGKVFILATLVLNVLDNRPKVELVFHGLNPDDPGRKINSFREVLESSAHAPPLEFTPGNGGQVPGASSHYQWLTVSRTDR
ncbi:MAG: hypothetical protein R3190_18950 [Thermoanaerobaculia bacterium]|nr:hypothetical protein [Thermoanaerobaculia bacterium]